MAAAYVRRSLSPCHSACGLCHDELQRGVAQPRRAYGAANAFGVDAPLGDGQDGGAGGGLVSGLEHTNFFERDASNLKLHRALASIPSWNLLAQATLSPLSP
jgi:hypothetical protein